MLTVTITLDPTREEGPTVTEVSKLLGQVEAAVHHASHFAKVRLEVVDVGPGGRLADELERMGLNPQRIGAPAQAAQYLWMWDELQTGGSGIWVRLLKLDPGTIPPDGRPVDMEWLREWLPEKSWDGAPNLVFRVGGQIAPYATAPRNDAERKALMLSQLRDTLLAHAIHLESHPRYEQRSTAFAQQAREKAAKAREKARQIDMLLQRANPDTGGVAE